MKLVTVQNKEEMGRRAADIFEAVLRVKPDAVLGLATGSSPIPLYRELVSRYEAGALDFSRARTVNLDEYVGLPASHNQSYRYFMDQNLFSRVNIDPVNTWLPDGMAADTAAECVRYDALVESLGGIDLQLLGVGRNGHIGFNEPADTFSNHTHVVRLTDSTAGANARFFSNPADVPEFAITLDIRHIMLAKKIVLIAGSEKREILERALTGEITPRAPVSVLQLHPDTTLILAEK